MLTSSLPLLAMSLACDAAGQLAFKKAATIAAATDSAWPVRWRGFASDPWIWLGIGLFVVEFVLWLGVLSLLPLSQGVLLGSAGTLVMLIAGRVCFGERLGPLKLLGALLIGLGVAVVGLN